MASRRFGTVVFGLVAGVTVGTVGTGYLQQKIEQTEYNILSKFNLSPQQQAILGVDLTVDPQKKQQLNPRSYFERDDASVARSRREFNESMRRIHGYLYNRLVSDGHVPPADSSSSSSDNNNRNEQTIRQRYDELKKKWSS